MKPASRLCLALLLASTAAGAANLYKWKDANGVTQYSEKPPTGQQYEARRIDSRAGVAPVAETVEAKQSQDCLNARSNLELLGSDKAVMQDSDGDGKPDARLDDAQREAQKNLAEAAAKAYCKPSGT
ncbi:MAG TPA: DUF4124 domain-containing protein [Xanthomonadaceae bacterium]|nr:DUF4124 domain-containing protein [Xanthomonadaceae bacterium]